jgi:hypothetical protein
MAYAAYNSLLLLLFIVFTYHSLNHLKIGKIIMLSNMRQFAENKFFKAFLGLILVSFILVSVNEVFSNKNDEIVAIVKNYKITAQELHPLIQTELNQYQHTFGKALNQGQIERLQIKEYILEQLINRKLLEFAGDDLGLVISDKVAAEYVLADEFFFNDLKVFDRIKFNEFLAQLKTTEEKYLKALRKDLQVKFLVQSIMGQHLQPQLIAPHYYNYQKQERQVELISFSPKDLVKEIVPSEDDLIKFYDNNLPLFLVPEYRNFSYVELNSQDLASGIVLQDEEIKKEYDETSLDYQNAGLSNSLEKVKEKLIADKSQDALYKLMEKIEDELYSGANISEIANKYHLTIKYAKEVDDKGNNKATNKKTLPQTEILKLAYNLSQAKECEIELKKDNSSFFIVELQEIFPSYIQSFIQAKDKTKEHYVELMLREKELIVAQEIKKKLQANQNIATELNITTGELKLNREYINLPLTMVEEIFQLGVNDVSNPYQHNKKMVIAKLKSISYPLINKEDFNNKLYHKLVSDLQYSLSQDAIAQYLKALRKRYSVKIMPLATLSGE